MTWTAYIDESKRRDYLLCAVVVPAVDKAKIRAELKKAKGRRHQIHMNDLTKEERRRFATLAAGLGVQAYMFTTRGSGRDRDLRDIVLDAAIPHLVDQGCGDLVLESSTLDHGDRMKIHNILGPDHPTTYGHAGKNELLLALPDIFAWSWGAGGWFKTTVKPLVTDLGMFEP